VKRFFGVDGFLPGTLLYKQHFHEEIPKVKAIFKESKPKMLNVDTAKKFAAGVVDEVNVISDVEKANMR